MIETRRHRDAEMRRGFDSIISAALRVSASLRFKHDLSMTTETRIQMEETE
jgi:hypothetical protein